MDSVLPHTHHQRVHSSRYDLLHFRGERRRLSVRDHGASSFVTALFKHSPRWYIRKYIIGISGHPKCVESILALETERIIDHHFTAQRKKRHVVAELPHLNWIRMMIWKLSVAIENL